MKIVSKLFIIICVLVCNMQILVAQKTTISIDKIVTNQKVSGSVQHLDPADYSNYKVLLYVYTDQWYIHPYAGQGAGLSWASIDKDGTWVIKTIKREISAGKVAAILVKKNYPEPNQTQSVDVIPNKAIIIRNLSGTQDYGKL
jgi:hypothetical protein